MDQTGNGYYTFSSGVLSYCFYLKVHQGLLSDVTEGNNRMVLSSDGTIEQVTHYYPYGGVIGDISTLHSDVTKGNNESFQKYKFEGKELDRTFGLDYYDIHARQYFAMAPMWDRIDSLAEKYYSISPYAFCNGDPVNHVDRDGKWAETLWDAANVIMDVKSARDNFSNGDIASGLVDVGATIIDCLAVVAPGIPGGIGTVVKAARSADNVTDAIKALDNSSDVVKTAEKSIDGTKLLRKAPPPNGGSAKPHGGKLHIDKIDEAINSIPKGAENIRKNQVQVNFEGYRVGDNRLDLQYEYKGKHFNIEFDTKLNQMEHHKKIINENDPNSINYFNYIGK